MYISRVKLENVRGFAEPRSVDLTLTRPNGAHAGWTVLAGRNGSGKTSLLRAVALAVGGPDVALKLVPDFRDWITTGQQSASVEVSIRSGDAGDHWSGEDPRPRQSVQRMQWVRDASLVGPRSEAQPLLRAGSDAHAEHGPWQANPSGWFCAAYGPFRRLAGGGSETRRFTGTPGPLARMATLFHEDATLAEGVEWLIEQHLRAFERKPGAAELKQAALEILGHDLLPDQVRVCDVDSEGLWVESGGERFPLREMSDGYRTITALIVDFLKQLSEAYDGLSLEHLDGRPIITSPGVVLIDEIDAHLHVTWQQRIAGWLKGHFPNIQFIVTTHSPYICQAADENGLIRLPGPHEDTQPRVVGPDLYQRVVFGSGDDAAISELFGLDSPYSPRAGQLRRELAELEAKVITGEASGEEIADYETLRRRLNSSLVARVGEVSASLRTPSELGE